MLVSHLAHARHHTEITSFTPLHGFVRLVGSLQAPGNPASKQWPVDRNPMCLSKETCLSCRTALLYPCFPKLLDFVRDLKILFLIMQILIQYVRGTSRESVFPTGPQIMPMLQSQEATLSSKWLTGLCGQRQF